MNVRKSLSLLKKQYYLRQRIKRVYRFQERLLKDICDKRNIQLAELTSDERQMALNSGWSALLPSKPHGQDYRFYKTFEGFDSGYIELETFVPIVLRTLNPSVFYPAFQYKGLYNSLYERMNQPKTYLKVMNGVWYDGAMNTVNHDVKDIFGSADRFLLKPIGDFGGHGVEIVSTGDDVLAVLDNQKGDFVCQEIVKQSESTRQFSSSSLNTFRITTLFINGRCTAENILFRHGRGDSVVDNGASGGVMVGVSKEGLFRPYGYDRYANRYEESPNGIRYAGCKIDKVKDLVALVEDAHRRYIPVCGMAGWDVALDEADRPVFIEVNLGDPGIRFEQLCSAQPIFADRTPEVIEYVREHKERLHLYKDIMGASIV